MDSATTDDHETSNEELSLDGEDELSLDKRSGSEGSDTFSGQKLRDDSKTNESDRDIRGKQKRYERYHHGRYSTSYQALVDEPTGLSSPTSNLIYDRPLRDSQIGLTIWSAREKEVFFQSLSLKGRDDLRRIAEDIGSKSEPEVQAYLQLLEQGIRIQHLDESRVNLLSFADMPASWEVSEECIAALDSSANACFRREQELEESIEKQKHGKFWLLDEDSAVLVEESLESETDSGLTDSQPELYRAFELIDLKLLLELSSRIFMNSTEPEENWRSFAEHGQTPGLFASAYIDLYDIAVVLVKRLVSSAIFFAMSRLRITNGTKYQHGNYVRKEDVTAAFDILGMCSSSDSFWLGVARRCRLDVSESHKVRKMHASKLTYDEVESTLARPRRRSSSTTSSPIRKLNLHKRMTEIPTDTTSTGSGANGYSSYSSENESVESILEDAEPTINPNTDEAQEVYADSLDLQASKQEEHRLWNIVKKRPPEEPTALPETHLKRPKTVRKERQELFGWRTWLDYKPQWESYETSVPASGFALNNRQHGKDFVIGETGTADSPLREVPDVAGVADQISETDPGTGEEFEDSEIEEMPRESTGGSEDSPQ